MIVAYDENRAIGANGDLLWEKKDMSADLKFFRETTMNAAIIMGRKTLESIGIALPGRQNIVLTSAESVDIPNVEVAHTLDDAFMLADGKEEVFVIGGGEIYRQALADVERIYATEVDHTFENADTHFPALDDSWQEKDRKSIPAGEKNIYPISFVTYERK